MTKFKVKVNGTCPSNAISRIPYLILRLYFISKLTQTFPFKIPITRQARPHDFATQSVVNTAQRQKSNKLIMMGAVAFMLIGATVQYFFIRYMSHI